MAQEARKGWREGGSGFIGVSYNANCGSKPYQAKVRREGKTPSLSSPDPDPHPSPTLLSNPCSGEP